MSGLILLFICIEDFVQDWNKRKGLEVAVKISLIAYNSMTYWCSSISHLKILLFTKNENKFEIVEMKTSFEAFGRGNFPQLGAHGQNALQPGWLEQAL